MARIDSYRLCNYMKPVKQKWHCAKHPLTMKEGEAGQVGGLSLWCIAVGVSADSRITLHDLFSRTPKTRLSERLSLRVKTAETLCPQMNISAFSLEERLVLKHRSQISDVIFVRSTDPM